MNSSSSIFPALKVESIGKHEAILPVVLHFCPQIGSIHMDEYIGVCRQQGKYTPPLRGQWKGGGLGQQVGCLILAGRVSGPVAVPGCRLAGDELQKVV